MNGVIGNREDSLCLCVLDRELVVDDERLLDPGVVWMAWMAPCNDCNRWRPPALDPTRGLDAIGVLTPTLGETTAGDAISGDFEVLQEGSSPCC